MDNLYLNSALCPNCVNVLHRTRELNPSKAYRVDRDEGGYFVKCPHCSIRVAMNWISVLPIGKFEVSSIQTYDAL